MDLTYEQPYEPDASEPVVWEWRTLRDAYQKRPPTEYVVDKYLATESLNIVYGAPGSLKSMLLASLCVHVAGGLPWLPGCAGPGEGIAVMQSPVIWVDLDNGKRRTDERFDALGKAAKLKPDAPLYYVSMPSPSLVAHDIETMGYLRDCAWQYGAKLIVVDNLGLITGDADENSAQMARVMGNLRALAERTGAAIVLVHHQRKGGAGQGRAGDALRGHSSIEAAIDLALLVMRDGDSGEVITKSTKTRGVDVPTVAARFNFEHVPGTNDLEVAWFDGRQTTGEDRLRLTILEIVDNDPGIPKDKLIETVREQMRPDVIGVNKIRAEISNLVAKEQLLDERKNGTYRQLFTR